MYAGRRLFAVPCRSFLHRSAFVGDPWKQHKSLLALVQQPLCRTSFSKCQRHEQRDQEKIKRSVSLGEMMSNTPAATVPPNAPTIINAFKNDKTANLEVKWVGGGLDIYPYVWLRDNCQCESCFHPVGYARQTLQVDVIDAQPTNVQVSEGGGDVKVKWADGHVGIYPSQWLHERAFNSTQQGIRAKVLRLNKEPWGNEMSAKIPRADFKSLLESDSALLTFLKQLEVLGFVLVSGAPTAYGEVKRLMNHIGFIKKTHYGETFAVHDKEVAYNLAYTDGALNVHADLPYVESMPSIQLLHCISQIQSEGGETQLVDGLNVVNQMREAHPDKFSILSRVHVDFYDVGVDNDREFHCINQMPVICVNQHGEVTRINFTVHGRDSFLNAPLSEVTRWYDALVTFNKLCYQPENYIRYKMKEGDISVFDNMRILHGRTGYKSAKGTRQLEGGYIDWDCARSKRRVLQKKLNM